MEMERVDFKETATLLRRRRRNRMKSWAGPAASLAQLAADVFASPLVSVLCENCLLDVVVVVVVVVMDRRRVDRTGRWPL